MSQKQEPMTRAEWRKQQKQKQKEQKTQGDRAVAFDEKPMKANEIVDKSKKRSLLRKSEDKNRVQTNEKGNKVDRFLNKVIIILVLLIIILCIFIFNV